MIKIDIAKSYFDTLDGKLDLDECLMLSGKFAGVCYDLEGFNKLKEESEEKTKRRIVLTKDNGHHSVYDHIYMSLNITNIPKILAMILNNEKEYTTSEKSARYTPIKVSDDRVISKREIELYEKWLKIFERKINDVYKDTFSESKITKLAQENARYLVTVFMPTTMIYTTSLRQINYIVSWFKKYIKEQASNDDFSHKLSKYMQEFIDELEKLNILDEGLLKNEKNRSISLFGSNLKEKEEYFGDVYATVYEGSFAMLAQAQRHRTIDYKIEINDDDKYFIPPILLDDDALKNEWSEDIKSVKDVYPCGKLITIFERGTYENFILKCKERLCSCAQLEIMNQTKNTLHKYSEALEKSNNPLKEDIKNYLKGARCTFKDFVCYSKCNFKDGINLKNKI